MKKNKYSTPLWVLATILAGMLSPMQSAVNGQLGHWLQDGNACAVTAKIALTGAVSFGMFLRQIVSTFQHLLKASVIIAFQPHRRPGRKMHQRGMAPDIHSQGTAPRLFNHPGQ